MGSVQSPGSPWWFHLPFLLQDYLEDFAVSSGLYVGAVANSIAPVCAASAWVGEVTVVL